MDCDSESALLLLMTQIASIGRSTRPHAKFEARDPDYRGWLWPGTALPPEEKRLFSSMDSDLELEFPAVMAQTISLVSSMDLDSLPKPDSEVISLIKQTISLFISESESKPESKLVSLVSQIISHVSARDYSESKSKLIPLVDKVFSFDPEPEIITLVYRIISLVSCMSLSLELKLKSLVTQINFFLTSDWQPKPESNLVSLVKQIIPLVSSLDLDTQPKPKSELILLTTQLVSLFNTISESQPELVSLLSQITPLVNSLDSDSETKLESELLSIIHQLLNLKLDTRLFSLIHKISSLVKCMNLEPKHIISLCPQEVVREEGGKFRRTGKVVNGGKSHCERGNKKLLRNKKLHEIPIENHTAYFHCEDCHGKKHDEDAQAPLEVKHVLHRKHTLQLVLFENWWGGWTMKCSCCEEDLAEVFYYCLVCDYAMNIACSTKVTNFYIDHPKWHEHSLMLFPRSDFLTCDVCALADSFTPIYMCPPCDFVVHLTCLNLPRVIQISRHPHRISFRPSFDQGDWHCRVCRRKIENDYGGYSCIKEGCSYAAHSRCATQRIVWDGIELEGMPEETEEEEVEPFVRINDGIIQHFSHQDHHLRLDEDTSRDYDENKLCQACVRPIYFGNFYSCMQCDFILHEACASCTRKIHHPIHPHLLTLVSGYDGVMDYDEGSCSACSRMCTIGFFYGCSKKGCHFKLDVHCATISEPLIHDSHQHPLFLTSEPKARRICRVCKNSKPVQEETFSCIEECDFALCFWCATLPQKVRYKHDKHMLTLSYGEETSTAAYWCEVCEGNVNPKERFYMCDEYCSATLHIKCLLGRYFDMNPGLLLTNYLDLDIDVLPNQRMSRPICQGCYKRCPDKIVFIYFGLTLCSLPCVCERELG